MLDRGMGCSLRLGHGDVMGMPWRELRAWRREIERYIKKEEAATKK